MAYIEGKRPPEYASKIAHSRIIKDPYVIEFLKRCTIQEKDPEEAFKCIESIPQKGVGHNPIKRVMAADGGTTEVYVQEGFPSQTMGYIQYGVSYFEMDDFNELSKMEFIGYDDISKLTNSESFRFVLFGKNIRFTDCENIKDSFRVSLYEHLREANVKNYNLMDTLAWILFKEYSPANEREFVSIQCPHCPNSQNSVKLFKSTMEEHTTKCPHCGETIYLTDVLRLHQKVTEDSASGLQKPLTLLLEQLLLVHYIRISLDIDPDRLNETLFIRDGPLAFFDALSNFSTPMYELFKYLLENQNLFLVGIEKSGAFVDFARSIDQYMENGSVMILNSDYIYKYIYYGSSGNQNGYGFNSYYGCKVIFKSVKGDIYVLTLPTTERSMIDPKKESFKNMDIILDSLTRLKSDRYDNALLPIALVNKTVSISDVPGSAILEKLTRNIE